MKKLLLVIAIMAAVVTSFGQITGICPANKDVVLKGKDGKDSVKLVWSERFKTMQPIPVIANQVDSSLVIAVYVGMFAGVEMPVDAVKASGCDNVLTGMAMDYTPTKWFSIHSWAGLQLSSDTSVLHTERFWFKMQTFNKKLSLEFGAMPSIPTEQRPWWITGPGQFETKTTQQIAGGGIGAKAKYQISKNWGVATGVVERNGQPEYSARCNYKDSLVLSGWYSKWDENFGSALTLKTKPLSTTLVWNQKKRISNILVFNLPNGRSIYSDTGYDLKSKKLIRGEWGILQFFDGKWIDVLIGPGWNHEKQALEFYCLITL